MTFLVENLAPRSIRFGLRAALVTGAYVAAAAVTLLTVILLRARVDTATLGGFLGFLFIATTSAGLEPATIKAAALADGSLETIDSRACFLAVAVKALGASPLMAVAWKFADPGVGISDLAWTPAILLAGLWTTDRRAMLDLRGDHAQATGLKQGSLAGGVALAGLLLAFHAPLAVAIGASTLARLAPLLGGELLDGRPRPWRETRVQTWRLLVDRRWLEFATVSIIAAAGGSVDRLFGLRYLTAADYAGYYVVVEVFTKFWLISYLLGPIVFARRASGRGGPEFERLAYGLTLAAGLVFIGLVALAVGLAPDRFARLAGGAFGFSSLALAVAIVIGALSQLRTSALQGAGRSAQALAAAAVGAAAAVPLFYFAARHDGAKGLLLAWLLKPVVEMVVLLWRPRTTSRLEVR